MWFEPVSTLDLIIKGLLIGVVASAPMGPVGVLCIQRTLNKGRWYGFVTGIGAAFSDIIYALITGFGMSFVVDFIENKDNMFYLQMAGSIMLFRMVHLPLQSGEIHPPDFSPQGYADTQYGDRFSGHVFQPSHHLSVRGVVRPLHLCRPRPRGTAISGLLVHTRRSHDMVVRPDLFHRQGAQPFRCQRHLFAEQAHRSGCHCGLYRGVCRHADRFIVINICI